MTTFADPAVTDAAVPDALAALRAGRPVLVRDPAGREDGGDVVLPAALAEPHWTAWTVRQTSGFLCAPLPAALADALDLPPMTRDGDPRTTAYAVSVDAATGITTGISATDRARTARVLADPASTPADLTRPGHLVPIRTCENGVPSRSGRAEAAVDLCRLAGLPPVALIGEIVTDEGRTARAHEVAKLGAEHGLPVLTVTELATHRLFHGNGSRARVTRIRTTRMSTIDSELDAVGFRDGVTGAEHTVLRGPGTPTDPRVSVHLECSMGDVFGTLSCPCGRRLAEAIARIAHDGGLLVYLRRGTGSEMAHAWSRADDGAVAAILVELGVPAVRLIAGPATPEGLAPGGISAVPEPSPHPIPTCTKENS